MTFIEYLKTQINRPKNPDVGDYISDFASEAINDKTCPSYSASYDEWLSYLESESAIPKAISSFNIAWREFCEL